MDDIEISENLGYSSLIWRKMKINHIPLEADILREKLQELSTKKNKPLDQIAKQMGIEKGILINFVIDKKEIDQMDLIRIHNWIKKYGRIKT